MNGSHKDRQLKLQCHDELRNGRRLGGGEKGNSQEDK